MVGLGAAAAWKGFGWSANGFLAAPAATLGCTRLSRLTKLECSPNKLSTIFLGLAPVFIPTGFPSRSVWPDPPMGSRPLRSHGLGDCEAVCLAPAEGETVPCIGLPPNTPPDPPLCP